MNNECLYKVSVNADKRYYLDDKRIEHADSFLNTMEKFNDAKIRLYNALYDKSILNQGPLSVENGNKTYSSFLKDEFSLNAYYCAAVNSAASGVLSSQKQLFPVDISNKEEDLLARDHKIIEYEDRLSRKQEIKEALVTYAKTGVWKTLYNRRIKDGHIFYGNTDCGSVDDYERKIENDIRNLKHTLKLMREARKCAEAKLIKRKNEGIQRVMFGGKKFYKTKDTTQISIQDWKDEFNFRRHCSMMLPGRHTSKFGNFLVKFSPYYNTLSVRCIDGNECVFPEFCLSRFKGEYLSLFNRKPEERESIGYNFQLHKDKDGRIYCIISAVLTLENKYQNSGFENGCVAIDINVDRIAVSNLGAKGNLIKFFTVPFDLKYKTSGQVKCIIGNTMAFIGDYCNEVHKCLIMENLNFDSTKQGLKYGSKVRNKILSDFAYSKFMSCAVSQGYKHKFTVYTINPAYTSTAAKILYMRKFGCQVHEAASYVIGLCGMGMFDKCAVPDRMVQMFPKQKTKDNIDNSVSLKDGTIKVEDTSKYKNNVNSTDSTRSNKKPFSEWHRTNKNPVVVNIQDSLYSKYGDQWKIMVRYMKGVPLHAYYMKVKDNDWKTSRKRTLKSYFSILKEKASIKPVECKNI